jgi:transcriptional regulator with XRE-family HTH domain
MAFVYCMNYQLAGGDTMQDQTATAMSESELARRANVSVAVLRKWRRDQSGPRYLKLGRLVRYLERDVDTWLEAHAVDGQQGSAPGAGNMSSRRAR